MAGKDGIKAVAFISGADAEKIGFTVQILNQKRVLGTVRATYWQRKMPKQYHRDKEAGKIKAFSRYVAGIRSTKPQQKWRFSLQSWRGQKTKEVLQFVFLLAQQECWGLLQRLNLEAQDEVKAVLEGNFGYADRLTGWRIVKTQRYSGRAEELFFEGRKKTPVIWGYLNRPDFFQKERDEWEDKDQYREAVLEQLISLWRNVPQLLVAAAYGIQTLLYAPDIPREGERTPRGEMQLRDNLEVPLALVVTGQHRISVKAARIFADVNYGADQKLYDRSWISTVSREENLLFPCFAHGRLRNLSAFDVSEEQEIDTHLLDVWKRQRSCGLAPVVRMPQWKRTAVRTSDLEIPVVLRFEKSQRDIFPPKAVAQVNAHWKYLLRKFVSWLEGKGEGVLAPNSLRITSYSNWYKQIPPERKEERSFLRQKPAYGSLVFALDVFLRYCREENKIGYSEQQELYSLCLEQLRAAAQLVAQTELERLHQYFDPVFEGKHPAGGKGVPFAIWCGQERGSKTECLYVEANRWEEDYCRKTGSSACPTEILRQLKPYLLRRHDQKALGMQRVFHDPQSGQARKLYVLCIRKELFLSKQ